jgi:hypothetical protein
MRTASSARTTAGLWRFDAGPSSFNHKTPRSGRARPAERAAASTSRSDSELHLERSDLSRANLSGADLSDSNLEKCDIDQAVLDGARLDSANMHGVRGTPIARSGSGPYR